MELNNIFDAIPAKIQDELFDPIIQKGKLKIERIVSMGHISPKQGWYNQEQDEWLIVLEGSARILFESGQEVSLGTGSYLNIPAHTKHKVTWTKPETPTIWLAVHY